MTGDITLGIALFIVGLALAIFMAPSLMHRHDVSWDLNGVVGACRLFGPTLGLARTRILWPDIVKVGITATQYWFVEARDGRRIYWSYLYPGYGVFWQEVVARARNLDKPQLPLV